MKSTVLRYTVLRLMIFFGCLIVFWLLGLRREDQQVFLLLAAALASVVLSYFFLRRDRDTFSEVIAERMQRRAEARREGLHGVDEDAEDAELGVTPEEARRATDRGADQESSGS